MLYLRYICFLHYSDMKRGALCFHLRGFKYFFVNDRVDMSFSKEKTYSVSNQYQVKIYMYGLLPYMLVKSSPLSFGFHFGDIYLQIGMTVKIAMVLVLSISVDNNLTRGSLLENESGDLSALLDKA